MSMRLQIEIIQIFSFKTCDMPKPVDGVPSMGGFVPAPYSKGSVGKETEGRQKPWCGWFWVRQGEQGPRTWQAWPLLGLDPGCQGGEMTRAHIWVGQFKVREALGVRLSLPVQPGVGKIVITDSVLESM